MRGVFLDADTMAPGDLELGALEATLDEWTFYDRTDAREIAERVRDAAVVVLNKVRFGSEHFAAAPALRLICIAATGTDNVDLEAARSHQVTVCNVRGYATGSVPQHVFALLLALSTRLLDYAAAVRAGRWQESRQFCFLDYPIRELEGLTLGIVGYGDLGRAVARRAQGFGMRVLFADQPDHPERERLVPLDELLRRSDVITLHCPLTAETRGLIGAPELALMKPDALLINTARGGIVDEAALAAALREGGIGGAGVDVLSGEPPREGNPLLAADLPNLVVTPHIAWGSREARQRIVDDLVASIRGFLAGTPRSVVVG